MTVKDLVKETIDELEGINVPVKHLKELGFPIARSIDRLNAIMAAWEYEEREQAKKEAEEAGEPCLELVAEPADEAPAEEYAEEAPNEEN